jgi:hypothetical protein
MVFRFCLLVKANNNKAPTTATVESWMSAAYNNEPSPEFGTSEIKIAAEYPTDCREQKYGESFLRRHFAKRC